MQNVNSEYLDIYNESWSSNLNRGNEDFGDVEQSVSFIHKTNMLRKHHRILEIGCGIGKLTNFLFKDGFKNITATDLSSVSIDYGKEKFPDLDLRVMGAENLDFADKTFDVCMSFDLVEHIPDINSHFKEVHRVLVDNGCYLFQTPNIITNTIHETLKSRGFQWRKYHPSLQFAFGMKKKLLKAGFVDIKYIKMAPTSDYKIKQLPFILRVLFTTIPWERLPMFMQIGFWCIAKKA